MEKKQQYYVNTEGELVKKIGKDFHVIDAIDVNKDSKRIFFTKSKQES